MNFFKYINIPVLIISFAIGMFFVYITATDTRTILVYPTPDNIHLLQYRDKTNTCFSLTEMEVKCPTDPTQITQIPSQN